MLSNIDAVVLDIEGTTTPITFVKDKLFTYIRINLRSYLDRTIESEETQHDISCLRKQANEDVGAGLTVPPWAGGEEDCAKVIDNVVQNVLWQMDLDRKTTALKQLQGRIMVDGYAAGEIRGEFYSDVPHALTRMVGLGLKVYIYSSGSVFAQKLLFQYSTYGNLLEFLSGHFDTTIGAKVESASYSNIAKEIEVPPERILFLTDIPKEAYAAKSAELQVGLTIRPGNAPLSDEDRKAFPTLHSFDELFHS